jgi:hypothetical protein
VTRTSHAARNLLGYRGKRGASSRRRHGTEQQREEILPWDIGGWRGTTPAPGSTGRACRRPRRGRSAPSSAPPCSTRLTPANPSSRPSSRRSRARTSTGAAHPPLFFLWLGGSRATARRGCSIDRRGSLRFRIREFCAFTPDRLESSELCYVNESRELCFLFYLPSNYPRGILMRATQASFLSPLIKQRKG